MSAIDKFMPLLMEKEEEGNLTPIIQHGENTFVYIKYNNLYCILSNSLPRISVCLFMVAWCLNIYSGAKLKVIEGIASFEQLWWCHILLPSPLHNIIKRIMHKNSVYDVKYLLLQIMFDMLSM